MIKWKLKPEHKETRSSFYFAKDGFVIKIDEAGTSSIELPNRIWSLDIYYYTNSSKTQVFKDAVVVKFNKDKSIYEANAKKSATKLAKKLMAKYAHRANMFFSAIAS